MVVWLRWAILVADIGGYFQWINIETSNQIKSNECNLTDALWVYNLSAFWSASDTFDIHRIGQLLSHWTDIASYSLDLDWLHSDRHELWCTLQFLACSQNFRKYIEFHLDCFPPRIVANRFDSLYFDSDFVCNDCDVFSARLVLERQFWNHTACTYEYVHYSHSGWNTEISTFVDIFSCNKSQIEFNRKWSKELIFVCIPVWKFYEPIISHDETTVQTFMHQNVIIII